VTRGDDPSLDPGDPYIPEDEQPPTCDVCGDRHWHKTRISNADSEVLGLDAGAESWVECVYCPKCAHCGTLVVDMDEDPWQTRINSEDIYLCSSAACRDEWLGLNTDHVRPMGVE